MAAFTSIVTLENLKTFIQSEYPDNRVVFGDKDGSGDITGERGQTILNDECNIWEARFAKYYIRPFVLTDTLTKSIIQRIVYYTASYRIVEECFRGNEIPPVIKGWLEAALALFKEFAIGGLVLPGETSSDAGVITTETYTDRDMYEPKAASGKTIFKHPKYYGDDLLNA